jgi:NADH-quinone oxidoreductase subunit N
MSAISTTELLRLLWPEIIVVVTALVVLACDLLFLRSRPLRTRFAVAATVASMGCAGAVLRLVLAPGQASLGLIIANPLTQFVQIALLALTVITLLLSVDSTFTEHVGEFVLLVMLATTGMLLLVASRDILVIFLSLELLSLSLYILTGFDKRSPRSSEAALKYFLFGGMSAAFLLFGFSLLYGLSNSTNLRDIAATVHAGPLSPLLIVAMVTTVIGFGFKVAAVPFHFWAPDVYQAAPTPVAAFTASSSKVASFFIFFEIMALGFAGAQGSAAWMHLANGWAPVVAGVAALSMVLGNLVAITQTRLRRLLAYSAIAHAGYMLLAVVAHTEQSLAALLYYVVTYSLATLGIFAIAGVVEQHTGSDELTSFNGLSRRAPLLSICLFLFVLSLAGIPPLAGFFGKFYLFVAALDATPGSYGLLWLVVLAIAMSAVSLFYYLQVLKRVYVSKPAEGAGEIRPPLLTNIVVALLAAAVLVLGCAPHLLLGRVLAAARAVGL